MCGAQLNGTDRFCKICGTRIDSDKPAESPESIERKAEITEEVVFNPPYEEEPHHNRFYLVEDKTAAPAEGKEELKGFISDQELEKQRQNEELRENTDVRRVIPSNEFHWNVHEFAKTKNTEEAVFNWNLEDYSKPEQKEASAAFLEEELFREIRDESYRIKETNIERFFTFSKKNEEFQKLLDKEYEKLKRHPFAPDSEKAQEEDRVQNDNRAQNDNKVQNEEHAENLYANPVSSEESVSDQNRESVQTEDPYTEVPHTEMAKARADYFGGGLIKDNESIIKKLGDSHSEENQPTEELAQRPFREKTEEPPQPETQVPQFETEAEQLQIETTEDDLQEKSVEELAEALQRLTGENEFDKDGGVSKLEALFGKIPAAESEKTIALYKADDSKSDESNPAKPEQAEPEQAELEMEPAGPSQSSEPGEQLPQDEKPVFGAGWGVLEEENRSSRKKHRAGQIVLIIIAIILVFEIAILSIRFFAPGSGATRMIDETQTKIINVVSGWVDGINGLISGNDSNQNPAQDDDVKDGEENQPDPEKPVVPEAPKADPVPMADKEALVATQIHKNNNIQRVTNNDTLGFDSSKDYGIADLNNSKSIENNIWMEKDGQTIYYDQSIVGSIIAFDSQWIDYVNDGNKAVLSLMKKDSAAYKNAVGFSKVGKIKETFNVLEIGEIRQGSDGFYVWVHEEIEITEKGVTSAKKYNWIYYLEPVDGNLNIVNYFKFK
jgi:hypothetical protein